MRWRYLGNMNASSNRREEVGAAFCVDCGLHVDDTQSATDLW
jgi:hypothetical protein